MGKRYMAIAAALVATLAQTACDDAPVKSTSSDVKAEAGSDSKAGHGETGEREAEGKAPVVKLTDAQIALAGVKTASAARGEIQAPLVLTGEIALNQERLAYIVPRVTGYVSEIHKPIGSTVAAGETLATLESRELAELKNNFLLARERLTLAQNKFDREERLWKQKISSEQDYVDARNALAQADLELRTAQHNLQSVGVSPEAAMQDSGPLYPLTTPIAGVVIDWSLAVGQKLDGEGRAFVVADLDKLWASAVVNGKDFGRVRVGQPASIVSRTGGGNRYAGTVTWVSDIIDEKTRTQKIRVELENSERRLKPGMFVTVRVAVELKAGVILVPPGAVQVQRDESIVFVRQSDGQFSRREVKVGIRADDAVEILSGLTEGEPIVVEGSFTLRSELEKSGFEAGHGH